MSSIKHYLLFGFLPVPSLILLVLATGTELVASLDVFVFAGVQIAIGIVIVHRYGDVSSDSWTRGQIGQALLVAAPSLILLFNSTEGIPTAESVFIMSLVQIVIIVALGTWYLYKTSKQLPERNLQKLVNTPPAVAVGIAVIAAVTIAAVGGGPVPYEDPAEEFDDLLEESDDSVGESEDSTSGTDSSNQDSQTEFEIVEVELSNEGGRMIDTNATVTLENTGDSTGEITGYSMSVDEDSGGDSFLDDTVEPGDVITFSEELTHSPDGNNVLNASFWYSGGQINHTEELDITRAADLSGVTGDITSRELGGPEFDHLESTIENTGNIKLSLVEIYLVINGEEEVLWTSIGELSAGESVVLTNDESPVLTTELEEGSNTVEIVVKIDGETLDSQEISVST